ncbi:methyltransferase domain-containing protein [Caulobacter sp. S45]|uniref:methyltransferase domain-containing protein n=1 Tax=Caulobacter sp. S45 TaxID=1641861 RepID=UPI00131B69F1|nr:methyltransferase domain-containing protein [Caulobacter sp. S45]
MENAEKWDVEIEAATAAGFTHILHALRTRELRATKGAEGTMVSVGCNGLGYFEWIDQNLGRPERHIGLEFYIPKPEGLQDNVEWIPNTAGDMKAVATGTADLVFAGQTIEHLWWEELAGFFVESARVLKPRGRLLFDSPNREISNALRWNHPEHTIELSPQDAFKLASLAGFDVIKMVGHWLCETPDARLLPLDQVSGEGGWTVERRIREAEERPEAAFSWWCEAIKVEREVDVPAIYAFTRSLMRQHFARRLAKLSQSQRPVSRAPDGSWAHAPRGWQGALVFGPYAPLPEGSFVVRFTMQPYETKGSPGWAEVFSVNENIVLSRVDLPPRLGDKHIYVNLDLPQTTFGLEFRLWTNGSCDLTARLEPEIYRYGLG